MKIYRLRAPSQRCAIALFFLFTQATAFAQAAFDSSASGRANLPASDRSGVGGTATVTPTVARYFDPVQGSSSVDLVRRALAANAQLAAARLEVERARA